MAASLVSIIIPCHNAGRWLAATIESALGQTWPSCEVILVDDGSTDDSLALARTFEGRGVRVLAQQNRGASAARNRGLEAANGDFIQFLDADDLLAPDKVGLQVAALQSGEPGTVAAGPWGVFQGDTAEARFVSEPVWRDLAPVDWLVCSWGGGGMMHPAAWLVPRAVALGAGPWNEALNLDDDGEYFCRVLLRSRGVHFVADARSFYRAHDGPRLSARVGIRAAESSFQSCSLKERHLLAVDDSPAARRAVATIYSRFAWEQICAAPVLAEQAVGRWHALAPDLPPPRAGRLYNRAASLLGWRRARRLQLWAAQWRTK
jgi:glycosyltransferase involved in cell wall biosynthesis